MKKVFEGIGILALVCFSFLYTEKTANVVKDYDDIMVSIKNENQAYYIAATDAVIKENTIIPGANGKEININKSYSQMRRYGKFNQGLLVYKEVKPTVSIENNYEKYVIQGNPKKNMISIIFLVEENDSLDKILKILNDSNTKTNFFVDGKWLEKNNDSILTMMNQGHIIGNLSYNHDYTDSSYAWMDTFIKKVGKQKMGFCYNESEDSTALKLCALSKNYTIRPNIILGSSPLKELKEQVISGSIISIPTSKLIEGELLPMIRYIESKGYQITTLIDHLQE